MMKKILSILLLLSFPAFASAIIGDGPPIPVSIINGGTGGNGSQQPINLEVLGACGISDATTILNTAFATAATTGQAVYLPGGCTVNHNYDTAGVDLTLNGIVFYGDGETSILKATTAASTNPHLILYIQGNGTVVRGINFQANTTAPRSSQPYAGTLGVPVGVGATLTNFSIDHNYFTGTMMTAIGLDYAGSHGDVSFNQLLATFKSNPMIMQAPVDHVNVHDNIISGTSADTCIETVDYNQLAISTNAYNNIYANNVSNCGAHGISVVGGYHINVENNFISNPVDRGIYIQAESGNTTSSIYDVLVEGNQIIGADAGNTGENESIYIGPGYSTYNVNRVHLIGNVIQMTNAYGTVGISNDGIDTDMSFNTISGDGTNGQYGINLAGGADPTVIGNYIGNLQQNAIQGNNGNAGSGTAKIIGNHFFNLAIGSSGAYPVIATNADGYTHLVEDNTYTAGANSVSSFMTCAGGQNVTLSGTIGISQIATNCNVTMGLYSTLPSTQTSNYVFTIADQNNFTLMNCGSACTLTVPPNSSVSYAVGQTLCAQSTGAGAVTLTEGSGVTFKDTCTAPTAPVFFAQYSTLCAKQTATNTWAVIGSCQ